jgi:hypothetical protein
MGLTTEVYIGYATFGLNPFVFACDAKGKFKVICYNIQNENGQYPCNIAIVNLPNDENSDDFELLLLLILLVLLLLFTLLLLLLLFPNIVCPLLC